MWNKGVTAADTLSEEGGTKVKAKGVLFRPVSDSVPSGIQKGLFGDRSRTRWIQILATLTPGDS